MKTETQGAETMDRDRVASLMTWTVGLGAAILSWAAWTGLARKCGWDETLHVGSRDGGITLRLAWLTAVIVDVYAMRAFRVWQRSAPWVREGTREYAKWSTYAAVFIGVLGNVAYHVMVATKTGTAPLWVVIPVSSLPPIMLGAIGHLNAIERRDRATWRRTQAQAVRLETETLAPPVSKTETRKVAKTVSRPIKTETTPIQTETQTETAETVETARETAKVSSLAAKSQSRSAQLQAIRDGFTRDKIDWVSRETLRDSVVSDAEITKYTGVTGKATMVKIRALLRVERDELRTTTVPDDASELVSVG